MKKVTFTLDDETVGYLDRTAARLGLPKSRVVREAIRIYGEQTGRLTAEERQAKLAAFDELVARIPDRSVEEVDREIAEVTRSRRRGGRSGSSR